MFYMNDEKTEIGRRVFTHEITKEEAAKEYDVSIQSIVEFVKMYMKAIKIKPIPEASKPLEIKQDYNDMSKEELIVELMKKEIEVARAKKGYSVKGGGKTKEFISINDSSTK